MNVLIARSVFARRGVSLLELILALALSVIVMAAIAWALHLHLNAFDTRRTDVEKSQLARAVLKLVADDLRSVVAHNAIDFTDAAELATTSSVAGLNNALSGTGNTNGTGSTGNSTNTNGSGTSSSSSQNQVSSGNLSSGSTSGTGTTSTGNTSSTGSTGGAEEEPKDLSADLMPSTIPGIYGNQYQLSVDVSRLPRIEDFMVSVGTSDIPSDVKTIAYYLGASAGPVDAAQDTLVAQRQAAQASSSTSAQGWGRGLMRRVLDRSVTQWAVNSGDTSRLDAQGELVAEEVVALEFRYFDGTAWLTQWDTQANGGLPQAIEIAVAISTGNADDVVPSTSPLSQDGVGQPLALQSGANIKVYSQVIRIPAAKPLEADASLETDAP